MVTEAVHDTDPTPAVLVRVRDRFGDRFVGSRVEAEQAAADLLNARAGDFGPDEAMRLGQLFNTHELGGRVRLDRFSPGFAGATMHKVTQDLERFNEVVADLWTAPLDTALDTLGSMFSDRSVLPGAGSSLPSMLLYLRDPDRFGVCLNATMRGLVEAVGCPPFKADGRASYERFCETLRGWRERYDVAPQEVDAVLTSLWRDSRGERQAVSTTVAFGDAPMRFLADMAAHNNGEWMQVNQDRYQKELRQPFVALLEQVATRHLRELDPQLDTVVKTNRVLASIRKRFSDAQGEYYEYLWGAFSRGRKQEDVQLAVLVQPEGLEVSLYLGSAQPEQMQRLRTALEVQGEELLAPLAPFHERLVWKLQGSRENPLEGERRALSVTDATDAVRWLDEGGTSIKWFVARNEPVLGSPELPDQIGRLFRALHPLASSAWGDDLNVIVNPNNDTHTAEDSTPTQLTIEQVAERCYLPPETLEEWASALTGTMRQGLFYGPPGTGKTFVASQLAEHLATSPEHVEVVQFHPSYSL